MLSELAKLMMQAGAQFRFIRDKRVADYRMMIEYLTTQADWADHFFAGKRDRSQIVQVRAMIDNIASRRSA